MSRPVGVARWGVVLLVIGLALFVAGCGGGSSSSEGGSSEASGVSASSSEASAEFLKPKGKNPIAAFGEEASDEEREAASTVLTDSLEARAAANFTAQCATLDMEAIKIIPAAEEKRSMCSKALHAFAEPLSSSKEIRKNTLSGPIAAFRVKGDSGYAMYHGNDGKNYAMPMEKEGGTWRVSSLTTIPLWTPTNPSGKSA